MATGIVEQRFALQGMTCLSCAQSVERVLVSTPGVSSAKVNFVANSVDIEYAPQLAPFATLERRVGEFGYRLIGNLQEADRSAGKLARRQLTQLLVTAGLTASIWALELSGWANALGWLVLVLTLLAVAIGGAPFFQGAWGQLKRREASMDTLVVLGTTGALVLTVIQTLFPRAVPHEAMIHSESAATILLFILVGRYIEERSKKRGASAVHGLRQMEPTTALRVLPTGDTEEIATIQLSVGDVVRISAGSAIPVDGVVVEGLSAVDESLISGESEARERGPRDAVVSGTLNLSATIDVRVTARGEGTLLAEMLRRVMAAQESRAPAQRLADRISAVFVPLVLILALGTWLVWGLTAANGGWLGAIYALTVLVVSCPCALGLATPIAVQVAIGRAAKEGILIRDAEALTTADRVRTMAFDKTGTLTQGRPAVAQVFRFGASDTLEVRKGLALLRGAAEGSRHPNSRAVAEWLEAEGIAIRTPAQVNETAGAGLIAHSLTGDEVRLGKPSWLTEAGWGSDALTECLAADALEGRSSVALGIAGAPVALLVLEDKVKPEAAVVLGELSSLGIRTMMLSGDRASAAALVAEPLGLSYRADLSPSDKADALRAERNEFGPAALIGDGANDAEALAGADLSVAMGSGAQAALDTAQVVLPGGSLAPLPKLIRLARQTQRVIAQNLAFAFAYNLVLLPLATGAFAPLQLDPRWAGAAMALSSLGVVLNSLRLMKAPNSTK
jgi:heavy metal translocating P-type ATPase